MKQQERGALYTKCSPFMVVMVVTKFTKISQLGPKRISSSCIRIKTDKILTCNIINYVTSVKWYAACWDCDTFYMFSESNQSLH